MRLIAAPELRTVLRFDVNRISRSTLRDMQSRHHEKRAAAADQAAYHLMKRIGQWDVFLHDGRDARPIDDRERQVAVRDVLGSTPIQTAGDLRSGHQATQARGAELVVGCLERRMEQWIILVPESSGSAFSSEPGHLPWEPYEA